MILTDTRWGTKLLVASAAHEVAPSILRLARAAAAVSNLWSSHPTVNCRTEWRSRKGSGPAVNGTDSCSAMNIKATVSLGVAAAQGESADVGSLLTAADTALKFVEVAWRQPR